MSRRGAIFDGIGLGKALEFPNSPQQRGLAYEDKWHSQRLAAKKKADAASANKGVEYKEELSKEPLTNPAIGQMIAELNAEAMEKFMKGSDDATVRYELAPKMTKIKDYIVRSNSIHESLEEKAKLIPNNSGYNKEAGVKIAKDMAFRRPDGTIETDPSKIDATKDWWSEAIRQRGNEFTDLTGLQNHLNESTPKDASKQKLNIRDKNGVVSQRNFSVRIPPLYDMATDDNGRYHTGEVKPKFEIATDDGRPFQMPKMDEKGNVILGTNQLPQLENVNILPESNFKDLVGKAGSAYYDNLMWRVQDEINKEEAETGQHIPLNSPQADLLKRRLAYKDLETSWGAMQGLQEEVKVQQPLPARTTVNIRNGSGAKEPTIRDVHADIVSAIQDPSKDILDKKTGKKVGTMANGLTDQAQKVIYKELAGKEDADGNKLDETNTFIHVTDNGVIELYRVNESKQPVIKADGKLDPAYRVKELTTVGTNFGAQAGAPDKRAVAKKGNTTVPQNNTAKTYKIGGKDFTEEQLQKGAAKNKMSLEQYKKSIGINE